MKEEHLLEAFDVWQELSQSPDERMAYISRLKYILTFCRCSRITKNTIFIEMDIIKNGQLVENGKDKVEKTRENFLEIDAVN